jgi:hypothetical protein
MLAILGPAVAAAATIVAAVFARGQAKRTEERQQLDTALNGLRLLSTGDGSNYALPGVVAGAIATLASLDSPVIALRALATCWADGAADARSATWLISEIFARYAERKNPEAIEQAQVEAAVMLDTHAHELCGETPGSLAWPMKLEFRWIPEAPLWARLYLLRAVLATQVEREASWWHYGGRLGWATSLLYAATQSDPDERVKTNAWRALKIVLPVVASKLVAVQSEYGMVPVRTIEQDMSAASEDRGSVVMLKAAFKRLQAWAARASQEDY